MYTVYIKTSQGNLKAFLMLQIKKRKIENSWGSDKIPGQPAKLQKKQYHEVYFCVYGTAFSMPIQQKFPLLLLLFSDFAGWVVLIKKSIFIKRNMTYAFRKCSTTRILPGRPHTLTPLINTSTLHSKVTLIWSVKKFS